MIELATPALRVVLDAERGGEIVWVGAPNGPNALFHRAWESPLPAGRHASYGSGALDWLSYYRGGWQVMFPNPGAECVVEGVPLPLHGEVSASPATVVEVGPLHVRLRSGARIDLPPGDVFVDESFDVPEADLRRGATGTWPDVPDQRDQRLDLSIVPGGPVERVLYLPGRPEGWAAIRDRERGVGVGIAWDVGTFAHLWLWQQIGGGRFPFFGRARIVALEPVSAWPSDGLARAVERERALWLPADSEVATWITLALFDPDAGPVRGVSREGQVTVERT